MWGRTTAYGTVTKMAIIVDATSSRYRFVFDGKEDPWRGREKKVLIRNGVLEENSDDQSLVLDLRTGRGEFSPPDDEYADLDCKLAKK